MLLFPGAYNSNKSRSGHNSHSGRVVGSRHGGVIIVIVVVSSLVVMVVVVVLEVVIRRRRSFPKRCCWDRGVCPSEGP